MTIKPFINLFLSGFVLFASSSAYNQSPPKKEILVLDNMKRVTDGNTSLFAAYSVYDFPYYVPSIEDISEKIDRIVNYLEKCTAREIIDTETNIPITDYKKLPPKFDLAESDYRLYKYTWGVTYSGMLKAYLVTGSPKFLNYSESRLRLLYNILPVVNKLVEADENYKSDFKEILKPRNLDESGAMCAAMIQWSRSGKLDFSLRKYIDSYTDFILNKQYRLEDGTFARKGPYESTLWLDDLYMSVPALSQLYALTGEEKYLNDAVRQILQFSSRMFVPQTNLYMHSYVTTMPVHPAFHWGRANGWAILAMSDLLDVMPQNHPDRPKILQQYQLFCFGLLQFQAKNGMWHQLINRSDSYLESSATAMFVYGLARGINNGWLDNKTFGPAALLGWNGLSTQINNMGQIENVCVGTGVSYEPAYYYYRNVHVYAAHGYGPVLMAGSEMITLIKNFKIEQGSSILFYDRK